MKHIVCTIEENSPTTSSSSGQSSGYSSTGSAASTCQTYGRVHHGPCYMTLGACFRCGQTRHYARYCPQLGFQQQFPQSSTASVAQAQFQPPPVQYQGTQFMGQQGRGRGGRGSARGFGQASTSQQGGRGQARVFTLTQQDAHVSIGDMP